MKIMENYMLKNKFFLRKHLIHFQYLVIYLYKILRNIKYIV